LNSFSLNSFSWFSLNLATFFFFLFLLIGIGIVFILL
jgi:hypothetical protein